MSFSFIETNHHRPFFFNKQIEGVPDRILHQERVQNNSRSSSPERVENLANERLKFQQHESNEKFSERKILGQNNSSTQNQNLRDYRPPFKHHPNKNNNVLIDLNEKKIKETSLNIHSLGLGSSIPFLKSLSILGLNNFKLRKGLNENEQQTLYILKEESLIYWNNDTNVLSLTHKAKKMLNDVKTNPQPYEVFTNTKKYIDGSVLGKWISNLDFRKIENQKEYAFLEGIHELGSLKKLTLRHTSSLNSNWLNQLPKRCPHLKELTLLGCNQLTVNDLISLSKSSKSLILNLGSNQNIKASSI